MAKRVASDLHNNGKGLSVTISADTQRFQAAWRKVAVTIAGDPFSEHHEGERRRKRKHDGRWAKVDRGAVLPLKWKAARKRKQLGAGETLTEAMAHTQMVMEVFGRVMADGIARGIASE